MKTKIMNMTEGNPLPQILRFSLPLMLGNVFQQLYTVVDTAVVGKALHVGALAALGAADWTNWLMLGVIQGVTQGFGILMAQEFGAQRYDRLNRVVGASTVLSAICSLLFLLVGQVMVGPVLEILQTPLEIRPDSALYLRIMFLGIPVVLSYNLLACILRSFGDGKTPLQAMIVASLTNIALDLLFVLVFRWGIAGAAAATLLAQLVSCLYCLRQVMRVEFLKLEKEDFRLQWPLAKRLLGLGSPMAFQNAIIAVGGMIVQSVVNGFGVLFIAGFTATNKLYGLLEIAATSYGYAMITFVGQNIGAGKPDRIRKGMGAGCVISVITSLIIGTLMVIFGKHIVSLFISGTPEEVEATVKIAYRYLVTMSVPLPVLYILHVARSAIQGMGNTVLPMVSGIAEFVMRTGAALLLPLLLGENGIMFAEILAWLGADIILIPSYFIQFRRINK